MAQTRTLGIRIPDLLIVAARRGLNAGDDVPESDVIRQALAHVGRVDVADYTPRRTGRPRTVRTV